MKKYFEIHCHVIIMIMLINITISSINNYHCLVIIMIISVK